MKRGFWLTTVFSVVVLVFIALVLFVGAAEAKKKKASKATDQTMSRTVGEQPNVLFILSDDQDIPSLEHMPNYQALKARGKTYTEATFTDPLCCPSRAGMLRGQYAHNTGIYTNSSGHNPAGGEGVFRNRGLDNSTIATGFDSAGYRPALVGKYMNEYGEHGTSTPEGWGYWYARIGNSQVRIDEDGHGGQSGNTVTPDSFPDAKNNERIEGFIKGNADKPWFAWNSYKAPHAGCNKAGQDENYGDSVPLPKSPAYNEQDVSDKPQYVQNLAPVTQAEEDNMRQFYRHRIECLQTLDRGIGRMMSALESTGQLDNTYVVFWTDNGFHMGDHGLTTGKKAPYEHDTTFPLTIAGPGIEAGEDDALISGADLLPTFNEISGGTNTHPVDGQSFLQDALGNAEFPRNRQLIEGKNGPQGGDGVPDYEVVRERQYKLIKYRYGFEELYDLQADPYELENLAQDPAYLPIVTELEVKLSAMMECVGEECSALENS